MPDKNKTTSRTTKTTSRSQTQNTNQPAAGRAAKGSQKTTQSAAGRAAGQSVTQLFEEAMNKPVSELYGQAMNTAETAMRAGLKMQEESSRWFTTILDQMTSPQEWQQWVQTMSDRLIPQTQKHMEENLRLVEQNSRTGVELVRKAFEAAQSTSVIEGQAKMLNFWGTALNAFRENAQAVTQANTKAIEMGVELMQKNVELAGSINGGGRRP